VNSGLQPKQWEERRKEAFMVIKYNRAANIDAKLKNKTVSPPSLDVRVLVRFQSISDVHGRDSVIARDHNIGVLASLDVNGSRDGQSSEERREHDSEVEMHLDCMNVSFWGCFVLRVKVC